MKRRIWNFRFPVSVLLLVLTIPAAFAAELRPKPLAVNGVVFTHGVASGELRPGRAILWTRVDRRATVQAEVSTDPSFGHGVRRVSAHATPENDFTVKIEVDRLDPATSYSYRFRSGASVSEAGTFRTPPAPRNATNVRFAWSSDFDGSPNPPINQFETLDRVRQDDVDFFIHLGDTIYADNTPACGSDVECMRGRYKQNRGYDALRHLMAATGSYAVWDDHEVVNDFTAETVDPAALASGRKAFEEYMPIRDHTDHSGYYRTLSWGKDVDLFFLDERTFRSAEAGVACQGDLLPTAPADVRLLAGLPADPPAGCLDAIADPNRTMLGAFQKRRFLWDLITSPATWKIVVNEVPMAELFGVPYDRWEGYAAERNEILGFIRDWGIRNVVFVTGDLHANMLVDVRQSVFGDPTPLAKELIAGPVAEHTLFEELVGLLGSEDGANGFIGLVTSLSAPDCFEPNTYAYGLVEVDAFTKRLTVTLKDSNGAAICGVTLEAQ